MSYNITNTSNSNHASHRGHYGPQHPLNADILHNLWQESDQKMYCGGRDWKRRKKALQATRASRKQNR